MFQISIKKINFIVFAILLGFGSACSSTSQPYAKNTISPDREPTSIGAGIAFAPNASFDLRDFKGKTYISFLKSKVKPALDRLSDAKNAGGGGFDNIGAAGFQKFASQLDKKTLASYKGAKFNRATGAAGAGLSDAQIAKAFETLKSVRPHSTVDALTYYEKDDAKWFEKNDMAVALKAAGVNAAPFDLATLYALTGGLGVKVKIDESNTNYHVLYKTGHTKPNEEVMSGRSFAASLEHAAADATDPEYLRDLQAFLVSTPDQTAFYHALIMTLASCDASEWHRLSNAGQSVLSDFLTVYTAEADRHLMVNLTPGNHPWEIDLAAVTFVSSVSADLKKVVVDGLLQDGELQKWFAPSTHNVPGGPHRSGIGITRKDRQKFQRAIYAYEMSTVEGRKLITAIQAIVGTGVKNDVIQSAFEFLSNRNTPTSLGARAERLADLMSQFIALARKDSPHIGDTVQTVE